MPSYLVAELLLALTVTYKSLSRLSGALVVEQDVRSFVGKDEPPAMAPQGRP